MINVPLRIEILEAMKNDWAITILSIGVIASSIVLGIYYYQEGAPVMTLVFVAAIALLVMTRLKLLSTKIQNMRIAMILGYIQEKDLIRECEECRIHAMNYLEGGFKGSAHRAWVTHIEEKHERRVEYGA